MFNSFNPIFEHRSIRRYKNDPIPKDVLEHIIEAGTRASNTGNMQVYSMIVTTDRDIKEKLSPCHFNQPMVKQAPVVVTFCADIHRFSIWCKQRGAIPEYDNFLWFINATIDSILAAQNVILAAESYGLGICVLGTTSYTAEKIVDILNLPKGVIPVTTVVMGYPDETPPLTDRLPVQAIVHQDTYQDYTPEKIDEFWVEREQSTETIKLLEINDLPSLARIFTEKRYKGQDNINYSKAYFDVLIKQGFFNQ